MQCNEAQFTLRVKEAVSSEREKTEKCANLNIGGTVFEGEDVLCITCLEPKIKIVSSIIKEGL